MANYSTLDAAIDAGITNMTVLRNDTRATTTTDTYATGIDWFYYNSVLVSNLYVDAKSWIGFGTNSAQLKVNNRSGAVYNEYKETGTISGKRYFKLTWKGTSYSSSSYKTTAAYQQYYDVFLFDTGQIFLNFWNVPTTTGSGTNALVCGSTTLTYTITAGVACQYTFTPSDPTTGTGWSVASGKPQLATYKSSGTAEYSVSLSGITGYSGSHISWTADTPTGTAVTAEAKLDSGSWTAITNGGAIPGAASGQSYTGSTLYVRLSLSTEDTAVTPTVSALTVVVNDGDDAKTLLVNLNPGSQNSFQNAVGAVRVVYDGTGGLSGSGGPVAAFNQSFTPTGLTYKEDQNDAEHIELSVSAVGTLTQVTYRSGYSSEHIEIASVSAVGTLTHVDGL